MKHQKWAVFFFALFLFAGFQLSTNSWKGLLFVYLGEERSPAALHRLSDFSKLDGKALTRAAHDQLVSHAEIVREQEELGVKLGHFLTKTAEGKREFACAVEHRKGVYDRVEMTFVGSGISEGGELPTFTVESDCRASRDLDWLETVWLPMREIAESNNNPFGKEGVSVQMKHMPSEWPETWTLTNIRLFHSANPDDSLIVDTSAVKREEKAKFTFDWKRPAPQKSEP